jgi:hypothetical protein
LTRTNYVNLAPGVVTGDETQGPFQTSASITIVYGIITVDGRPGTIRASLSLRDSNGNTRVSVDAGKATVKPSSYPLRARQRSETTSTSGHYGQTPVLLIVLVLVDGDDGRLPCSLPAAAPWPLRIRQSQVASSSRTVGAGQLAVQWRSVERVWLPARDSCCADRLLYFVAY